MTEQEYIDVCALRDISNALDALDRVNHKNMGSAITENEYKTVMPTLTRWQERLFRKINTKPLEDAHLTELSPIRVIIKLKPTQKIDGDTYRCTIDGNQRVVKSQYFEWYCTSPIEAVRSLEYSEIEHFKIESE